MSKDFSAQDLRGRSFQGEDLRGADFSGADLRGADFTDATLAAARFQDARTGPPRVWEVSLLLVALLLSAGAGFLLGLAGHVLRQQIDSGVWQRQAGGAAILAVVAAFLLASVVWGFWRALRVAVVTLVVVGGVAVIVLLVFDDVDGKRAAVLLTMLLVVILASIAGAFTRAIGGGFGTLAFVVVGLGGAFGVSRTGGSIGAVVVILTITFLARRTIGGDPRHARLRHLSVHRVASTIGTSFRGADLTGADFTSADVAFADFSNANLTGVSWNEARRAGTSKFDGGRVPITSNAAQSSDADSVSDPSRPTDTREGRANG